MAPCLTVPPLAAQVLLAEAIVAGTVCTASGGWDAALVSRLTNEETGVEWGGHLPGITGAAESTVGPETPVSPPPREVRGCGESWRQGCNTGMRDPGVTGCRVGFWLRAEGGRRALGSGRRGAGGPSPPGGAGLREAVGVLRGGGQATTLEGPRRVPQPRVQGFPASSQHSGAPGRWGEGGRALSGQGSVRVCPRAAPSRLVCVSAAGPAGSGRRLARGSRGRLALLP